MRSMLQSSFQKYVTNFQDKIEEKIFDWVLAALGCVLAALGCYLIRYLQNLILKFTGDGCYLIRYKSHVDNLKTQIEELRRAKDILQPYVDTAIGNQMKSEDVKRRLTESGDIIAVAEKILKDDNKGWYLNMIFRYQVSKRADKAASEAKNLKDEILKFIRVGYGGSTQEGGTVPSNRGYEDFESRRLIFTEVLEALKNPNITRIGVYGMGGIGKTMLVKEVLKEAEKDKLFNKYLFVVVSNPPDLKRIQREIAKKLGLNVDVESEESVLADRLYRRLLDEKILLVMDDIWKPIDLEALGISFGDDKKGSKLLLTSRFRRAVSNGRDTQKQFTVGVLSDDEARNLFEGIVGEFAKTPEFQPCMLNIVKECARLPIAITTVANALKDQTNIYVWKDFLKLLKMSTPKEIEGMDENVNKSIRLSYEFLGREEAKSLLLLCSLHPEDYNIEVEDLLKYGVGLGLFQNVDTIEEARCRVHSLVERLKDSSLLLDGDDKGEVKMHDVIRDVVINIAAEEKHMFTIRTVKELRTQSKCKDTVAISLPYINDDSDLPNQFECSKLELLLLFEQKDGFRIPDSFFEGLKYLKVLKLSVSTPGVFPSSLSSLENLQTLCLDGTELDAIIIGELKNLKALSLSLYDTERLPKEIGQLTHLQLLDLGKCSDLEFIPPNVLSNLKRLEELYLPDNVEWEVEAQSTERVTAMVSELDHLSHLTKLHIRIKNAKILPKAMVFERLKSYRIAIGSTLSRNEISETSRILKLGISFESDFGYKVLLRKCETLILVKLKGVKNILYELDSEGFQSLKHLTVQSNDEIQYIIKSMGVRGSVLESINLSHMINLERICYTRLPAESFRNLRVVKVRECHNLEFVFFSSMVGCFSHLQEMEIVDCEKMSEIIATERKEEIESNSDENIMFAKLRSLKLRKLLKLKGFFSDDESLVLFNRKVVFPNLEELEIEGMDSLKMISPDQLILDSFCKLENCESFAKLRTIKIVDCSSLKRVFPTSVAKALMQLEELEITDSATVEEIVAKEEGIETTTLSVFPRLISLILSSLPKLKSFYPGRHTSEELLLEKLVIYKCEKLKIFGSNKESVKETNRLGHDVSVIQQPLFFIEKDKFPKLEHLELNEGDAMNETCGGPSAKFCCNLKYLTLRGNGEIPNVEAPIARAGVSDFRRLKNIVPFSSTSFHYLWRLEVNNSDVLISLLTPSTARTLVQLRKIIVSGCKRMTEIVANEGSEAEAGDEIAFNNLTHLYLLDLPSLTAFHLGNRTIKFPSLKVVRGSDLPKLKIFWSGVLSTPKLRTIWMKKKLILKGEGDGDLDLNATIKEYWEAKLETCDQKFAGKVMYIFGGEIETNVDKKGSKLLLTSRFHRVVSNDMDTQKQFTVGVLSDDEARNLFEGIVGEFSKTPEFQPCMLKIVKECARLPIAITTVANALKNQTNIYVWKDFLKLLKMSKPKEIEGMDENVNKSIRLSYEFLDREEAKSLLLLCSLHPEDYNIEVEDLLKYGVGLGLFQNVDTIEEARCRVHSLVERLKDSSLLLDGDHKGVVKMHDVIRDVVINIAAEEKHWFTIRTVNELRTRSKCEDTVAISLPYINDDLDLPNQFECSKLELLLLFWQEDGFRIPDSFFEGLKDLKVLKLSVSTPGVFPSSLSSLENLQTLCLDGMELDAIIIGELKNLKALSLELNNTEWLPKEIGQLTHLQLLDLGKCFDLKFIPPNVLSNLKRLEELYLPDFVEWEVEAQSTERVTAMVSELDHLSHLTKLHICIENAKILPKAMVFKRLESYRIAIGSAWLWDDEISETSRILKLGISFESDFGYKVLLRKCETLILVKLKGVKNILYELDSEGFQSLKHLTVQSNDEIQYIIKLVGVLGPVFPILESINLSHMINLERICYTRLPAESFRNLRVVKVRECHNLEFVFSSSMVGCFSHLQEMEIVDCKNMSEIIATERKEEIEANSDENIMFAKLRSLKLEELLKLKGFFSDDEPLVLFNRKVVFPNLEELEIEGMDSLKMIWPDQPILDSFCKLENLIVTNFTNLTNILPPNMLRTLQNLKHLKIDSCGSIEEVCEIPRTNNVEETHDIVVTELRSLELINLGKLKHVWSMDPQGIFTFAKLGSIIIVGCSSLKRVFSTSEAKALMQLEELEIRDSATVEEIVAKEEGIETTTLSVFPRLISLILSSLPELKSFYPGWHASEELLLKKLIIYECDKLKIFGSNKESVKETNRLGHDVSVIQQPLFFIEKDKFPKLEYLELNEGDAMNETCGEPSAEFCCNLKYLILRGNGEIPNVEAPIARAGVSDFRRLKNIVPFSSTSFHYLMELTVYNSDVLISLLTPSTARTLVQLRMIEVWNCKRMTEIVANEGSEAEAGDEIAFNNLTELWLDDLPSLTAFHLGNRTIKFPSLEYVRGGNLPKLKIFCSGVLSTPKLRGIGAEGQWIGEKRIGKKEGDGDFDLNAAIKEFWEANYKLETCDQKFAEKTNTSEVRESEHDANDNLERDTSSEVGTHKVMENDD
ncbi:hypothetical protein ACB092_03G243400 [Castanea dentata]